MGLLVGVGVQVWFVALMGVAYGRVSCLGGVAIILIWDIGWVRVFECVCGMIRGVEVCL